MSAHTTPAQPLNICEAHVSRRPGSLPSAVINGETYTLTGSAAQSIPPNAFGPYLLAGYWREENAFEGCLASPPYPDTQANAEALFALRLVPGIGVVTARKLLAAFGGRVFQMLNRPEEIAKIPGISESRARGIAQAWEAAPHDRIHTVSLLLNIGIGPALAKRLWETYLTEAIHHVLANPYRLIEEEHGVGFKTADEIARKTGINLNDPARIHAGIRSLMQEAASREGHTVVLEDDLLRKAQALLDVPSQAIRAYLAGMPGLTNATWQARPAWSLAKYHSAESNLAKQLIRRLPPETKKLIGLPNDPILTKLDRDQIQAVIAAFASPLTIITGGPGVGKTLTITAILKVAQHLQKTVALTAPTGRAAKRMQEITGHSAYTLHRWFNCKPGQPPTRPPHTDILVIDEAGMKDVHMASWVMDHTPPNTSLVIVGDPDQLPSVQPGAFLRDILDARLWPITRLVRLYRQDANSLILKHAHDIKNGRVPRLYPTDLGNPQCPNQDKDAQWVEALTAESAIQNLERLFKRLLVEKKQMPGTPLERLFGAKDLLLLTPMKKGPLGTVEINKFCQRLLNETGRSISGAPWLRVGDPVIHIKNDPLLGRYNGDLGTVIADSPLAVAYPNGQTEYDDPTMIQLAYALTIHKAQGSEAKTVILLLHQMHYPLLTRQLVYTAMTRAQKRLYLIGAMRALFIAAKSTASDQRKTSLPRFLKEYAPKCNAHVPPCASGISHAKT